MRSPLYSGYYACFNTWCVSLCWLDTTEISLVIATAKLTTFASSAMYHGCSWNHVTKKGTYCQLPQINIVTTFLYTKLKKRRVLPLPSFCLQGKQGRSLTCSRVLLACSSEVIAYVWLDRLFGDWDPIARSDSLHGVVITGPFLRVVRRLRTLQ